MEVLPHVKTDRRYTDRLVEIHSHEDVPRSWQNTPIEALIMSQNFGWPVKSSDSPGLLIATCIEFRYALPIPRMYAYVIRRASGRLIGSEFTIGYVLAKGVQHIAMVGHNDCGMAKVPEALPRVIDAFVNQGWSRELAQQYCQKQAERYAMGDELDGQAAEYHRLRSLFRKVTIAPLFVSLYDSKFYIPKWYLEEQEKGSSMQSYRVPDEEIKKLLV
ncbi:MAG TPA: hypothetical protein V6D17_16430 [Candidatus Obscuribacterales bacterium]